LLIGAAAPYKLSARFDGDQSLRKRPMNRIIAPLSQMGARFDAKQNCLPLIVHGGTLKGITYRSPVSSAQVKSAVLLAGLNAEGETVLVEPERSRDHTERMLRVFGADIDTVEVDGAMHPRVRPSKLKGVANNVSGYTPSPAFQAAPTLIVPKSEGRVEDMLVNPLRLGFFDTLLEMVASISYEETHDPIGEPIANSVVKASKLQGAPP